MKRLEFRQCDYCDEWFSLKPLEGVRNGGVCHVCLEQACWDCLPEDDVAHCWAKWHRSSPALCPARCMDDDA